MSVSRCVNSTLADRIREPLFEPGRALSALHPVVQDRLKHEAATLAEVFQRSSSGSATQVILDGKYGLRKALNIKAVFA